MRMKSLNDVIGQFCSRSGPRFTNSFSIAIQIDGNFVSLSSRLLYSDPYKIFYKARQLCCRGTCKNLLRSDGEQRNYSKANFRSNLNCRQKIVSETGPWSIPVLMFCTMLHDHPSDVAMVISDVERMSHRKGANEGAWPGGDGGWWWNVGQIILYFLLIRDLTKPECYMKLSIAFYTHRQIYGWTDWWTDRQRKAIIELIPTAKN